MKEGGVAAKFPGAYEKGVAYLSRTQLDDGSWYVRSRAVKLQPYFQSGFPHGHEQWITYVATANTTVGAVAVGIYSSSPDSGGRPSPARVSTASAFAVSARAERSRK